MKSARKLARSTSGNQAMNGRNLLMTKLFISGTTKREAERHRYAAAGEYKGYMEPIVQQAAAGVRPPHQRRGV
jgi:hypothetical protein